MGERDPAEAADCGGADGARSLRSGRTKSLTLSSVTIDWKMPAREWQSARAQFALMFGDRFEACS